MEAGGLEAKCSGAEQSTDDSLDSTCWSSHIIERRSGLTALKQMRLCNGRCFAHLGGLQSPPSFSSDFPGLSSFSKSEQEK